MTKKYVCLVHGKLAVAKDVINLPLGRDSHQRLQFAVKAEGKPAVTEYEVKAFFPHLLVEQVLAAGLGQGSNLRKKAQVYQGFSLVECWPKTGRTHQIRVHMAHIKHPLVGDATYVGKKRQALDHIWCPRHFLHASWLNATHPRTGERMSWTAPLPADLEQVLTLVGE